MKHQSHFYGLNNIETRLWVLLTWDSKKPACNHPKQPTECISNNTAKCLNNITNKQPESKDITTN